MEIGLKKGPLRAAHTPSKVHITIWNADVCWYGVQNGIVITMINIPGHVLSSGWPLYKRSEITLIMVSKYAY